jgi:hypothetical protein
MPKLRIASGVNQDGVRVEIIDDVSSTRLAEFKLDPEQIWAILRGGVVNVEGEITKFPDRIGKRMFVESFVVPKEVLGRTFDRDAKIQLGHDYVKANYPGWDTYSARATSTGVTVVTRRWEEEN